MKVYNLNGAQVYFNAAVNLMDDELREYLHSEGYENEQEFFTAYEKAHIEKFGEEWVLSAPIPVY